MRFTSLVIELIRARPRLIVWIAVLAQAAMWLLVALLFYRSPPGSLATLLAFGREYQVGTDLGPPLPVWLADIAYRAAGGHMFGVYVLAELCEIATFITLYHLARAVVGTQQAVLAVLLTMTVLAFSSSALDFGPLVLARPLWTLLLLHSWQIIGQRRGNAWFAWSIEAGLLLLTTPAAIFLLALLVIFALSTAGGRRTLRALDPLFALIVVAVLALPYAVWLMRAETLVLPALPQIADLSARALHAAWLLGGLVLGAVAVPVLTFLNTPLFAGKSEEAPIIYRPPVEPLARNFVYFFALAPGARCGPDLRPVRARCRRRRRRCGAGHVGPRHGRRGRRSHRDAPRADAAHGVAGGHRGARRRRRAGCAVPALERHRRDRDIDAGARDLGLLRRQLCPPHQPSPARGRR